MICRLVGALAGLLLSAMLVSGANAQGRIVATHGDWQIRCERQTGAPSEQCALVQNVEAEDRVNVGLTVLMFVTADQQARIMRVLAPLGVLLPPGLSLSIDDNEVGAVGFARCMNEGCVAEVVLEDGLLERLEAGSTATFVIFQTPEEGVGIPISLAGLSDGLEALNDPPPPPSEVTLPDPVPGPSASVATDDRGAADALDTNRFAAAPLEADMRSELDRLLEDELFPYVLGGAVLLLILIVLAIVLIIRLAGRRKGARRQAEPEPRGGRVAPRVATAEDDDEAYAFAGDAPVPRAEPGRRPAGPRA